ncbi:phospholipase [bacterium]|nr:phospholipase [bacterium]MDA8968208.1 phospholipase [bacterium]MDB4506246.1 phospholipase [bacterium]
MPSDPKIEISTSLLRKLHRIHRQRADLNSQIARGPRQIQAGEALIAKAAAENLNVKEALKKANLISDEKQLQLKSREAQIDQLQTKLNSAASNREFNLLKEQIAADKQANSVLSDEILEAMDSIDGLETQLENASAQHDKQTSDQETRIADVEVKTTELQSELQRVDTELEESENGIPREVMVEYRRIIKAKGEDALAPVEDESCGGCYQVLTTQYIDRLRLSVLIRCPNCNAFLYMPESTRV